MRIRSLLRGGTVCAVSWALMLLVAPTTVPAAAADPNRTWPLGRVSSVGSDKVAPTLPPNDVDPGVPGPYQTVTGEYTLPDVTLPTLPKPVEMQAVVVSPEDVPPGSRPLVLFLHGQVAACYYPDRTGSDSIARGWPCRDGALPVPSYRGYLQTQQLLASQGHVTVSIAANGISGQNRGPDGGAQELSSLVRLHLAAWASWSAAGRSSAPAIVQAAPVTDLSRVLLVGHSLGGEGVNRAAMDSLSPPPADQDGFHGDVEWSIRGLALLAPRMAGQNPVPDVPSVTILPGCDGNLVGLEGQVAVDGTRQVGNGRALHSALYVVGANHAFFNAEWTPGISAAPGFDDALWLRDPICTASAATRLSAEEQRSVGATYVAAAAQLFLTGDDRVRPLLDGSGRRAPSADLARVLSHAVGGGRTPLVIPGKSVEVTNGRVCLAVTLDPDQACLQRKELWSRSPHFEPFWLDRHPIEEAGRYAIDLSPRRGRTVTLQPRRAVDVTGSTQLALRIAVSPGARDKRFEVAVVDTRGRRAVLGRVRIDGLPGSRKTVAYWAQEVRVPLGKINGRIAKLQLTPLDVVGKALLIDAWGWRTGTLTPRASSLLRLDLADHMVARCDAGHRSCRVPVRVVGRGSGTVRLFAVDRLGSPVKSWVADVRGGTTSIRVPFEMFGKSGFGAKGVVTIGVKAVRGVMVGNHMVKLTADN